MDDMHIVRFTYMLIATENGQVGRKLQQFVRNVEFGWDYSIWEISGVVFSGYPITPR